jgi:hypothetical protein
VSDSSGAISRRDSFRAAATQAATNIAAGNNSEISVTAIPGRVSPATSNTRTVIVKASATLAAVTTIRNRFRCRLVVID